MAVQAQYPSNLVFLNRGEQERKDIMNMDFTPLNTAFLDQSPVIFNANGGNESSRKRAREAMAPMALSSTPQHSLFSLQQHGSSTPPPSAALMTISHHHHHHNHSPLVSTGLRLAFEDHQHRNQSQSHNQSNLLSDDLAALINQHKDEVQQFLVAQDEQLRQTLADKRQRHLTSLLNTAQQVVAQRLRDKEAAVELATRRRAELEERLARLRTQSMALQMKAMADQATAASLHAKLGAAAGVGEECGESPYIEPDPVELNRACCRTCRARPATVVMLPCRHLCLCDVCDAAAAAAGGSVQCCPVCRSVRTGTVLVFLC